MNEDDPLLTLGLHLALMSLLAIGGIHTVVPEIHRVVVAREGWMTGVEFAAFFALAQAAPGPNLLFATLIGWKVAGITGGLVATAAICGPPFVLAYGMARAWLVWGKLAWFRTVQRGLVPLTIGLVVASAWLLTVAAAVGWWSYLITAASAVLVLTTRIPPLLVLLSAGVLGAAGLV
jgi:chromate transporter